MKNDFNEPNIPLEPVVGARPIIEFDFNEYRDLLDGVDVPEDQARELLQVLFSILCQFVELGFKVDICGNFAETLTGDAQSAPVELESAT